MPQWIGVPIILLDHVQLFHEEMSLWEEPESWLSFSLWDV